MNYLVVIGKCWDGQYEDGVWIWTLIVMTQPHQEEAAAQSMQAIVKVQLSAFIIKLTCQQVNGKQREGTVGKAKITSP